MVRIGFNEEKMNKKFMQNKKADIPITILVIGVFAICVLAIISFINSESQKSILGIEVIEEIHANVENFNFYLNNGFSKEEAAQEIGAEIIGNKLIVEKDVIANEVFNWNQFIFSIKYTKDLS